MKESTVLFGKNNNLVGIITEPGPLEFPQNPTAIVLLNAGFVHRVGPARIYTKMARSLAEAGFTVLRFDFSGIGDSEARKDQVPYEVSTVQDAQEAMNVLCDTRGVSRFILAGICSGADNSIRIGLSDPRVVGLIPIESYNFDTREYFIKTSIRRLFRWGMWRKLLTSQLHPWWRLKSLAIEVLSKGQPGSEEMSQVWELPPPSKMVADLRALVRRGVRICLIYDRLGASYHNYRLHLLREVRALRDSRSIRVELFDGTDHTFTPLSRQELLFKTVCDWALDNFAESKGGPQHGTEEGKPVTTGPREESRAVSPVPVLVLGSSLTALGVIRCLGREKIPSYFPCSKPDFVTHSRWCRPIFNSLDSFSGSEELTRYLEGLPFERLVLIPCSDSWGRAIAGLPPPMASRFPSSISSLENQDMLSDKGLFAQVLDGLGLPHPQTTLLTSEEDLLALSDADFEGAFLKPRRSQEFSLHFGVKAFRVSSRSEALQRFSEIQKAGFEVVLQEYIPGPPTAHYFIDGFIDQHGKICAWFARKRLRMYPPDFGNSSYMISIPLAEVSSAIESLERLLTSIKFRGIFSTEFKLDQRDGLFKILEVNARPWWFIEFAATSGVNVCTMAYEDALGREVKPVFNYAVGARCLHPYSDMLCCWEQNRRHLLNIPAWAKSWWGAKQTEFSWDDPLPGILSYLSMFRAVFLRRILRMKARGA